MAKIKKKVKKYIKKNEPTYKGLDKEQKKLVKARFEESVERYRKDLEAAKKKKRRKRLRQKSRLLRKEEKIGSDVICKVLKT